MHKYAITDHDFQTTVRQWLQEDGEVWAEADYLRTGGGGMVAYISSEMQFDHIIEHLTSGNLARASGGLFIFRNPKFLLKGVADDEFISRALKLIGDDEFMSAGAIYDDPLGRMMGSGDKGHKLLLETLEGFRERFVVLGRDAEWPNSNPGTAGYEDQTFIRASLLGNK